MQKECVINKDDLISSAIEVFDIEANSILALKNKLNADFNRAIDILYS